MSTILLAEAELTVGAHSDLTRHRAHPLRPPHRTAGWAAPPILSAVRARDDEAPFVSTGALPPSDVVGALVTEAYERYRDHDEGAPSDVYPVLARVPRGLFGLCVTGTNGVVHTAGDADAPFSIMSVAKPFVFALVCDALGPDAVRDHIGVNATGLAFNSLDAIELRGDGRTNPMVNPGAIATTSLLPGTTAGDRWQRPPRRDVPVRRAPPGAGRGDLRVGVGDQRAQPRHRRRAAASRPRGG